MPKTQDATPGSPTLLLAMPALHTWPLGPTRMETTIFPWSMAFWRKPRS
jgi:hypothetical protein